MPVVRRSVLAPLVPALLTMMQTMLVELGHRARELKVWKTTQVVLAMLSMARWE
jgi:hypothetical protein